MVHKKSSPPTCSMIENDSPPGAPLNTVMDGKCQNCDSQEPEEFVSCLFCNLQFHLNGCFENSDDDILSNSHSKTIYKAIHKTGKFAHRPGNFRFVCDPCLTNFESKQTCTTNDSVQILDKRVTNLSDDVSAIKEMLKMMTVSKDVSSTTTSPCVNPNQASGNVNVWDDKERVKSLLVVNKDVKLQNKIIEKFVTTLNI